MILFLALSVPLSLQQDPWVPAVEAGRAAMEKGDHEEAFRHLDYALSLVPDSGPVLELLLANAVQDPDARVMWAVDWAAYAADQRGVIKPSREVRASLPPDDSVPVDLAKARAAAVRELARFHGKWTKTRRVGGSLVAEWAEDLGRTLAAPSPALLNGPASEFDANLAPDHAGMKRVHTGLQNVIRTAFSSGKPRLALRAARCLRGMAAQASFDDLEGPPAPGWATNMGSAAGAVGRARRLLMDNNRVWTIEELEEMDLIQQREFTQAHGGFGEPGVSLSPRAWYRVETNCGWGTLHGSATTVEHHHVRLVGWYEQDPFVGRPGVLRVVPESHGLEMEGAPFWWAGGFQGGDTTTLKFTCGNIPGLGRGITHELTHRFDGAVFGGLPGWLSEGRATWTGGAYGSIYDTEFVPNHASPGTLLGALNMGYGSQAKLEELVGTGPEEYRDNYTAGYALWVYLNTWAGPDEPEEGEKLVPLYAERIQKYMRGKERRRGNPVQVFASFFADGKEGRPEGMEEFAADFTAFLQGFHWRNKAPWTARYTTKTPRGDPSPTIMDEPTWSWLRGRTEPWFGQDQARVAGEILLEVGRRKEAVDAFTWSLRVDEASDAILEDFAEILQKLGARDAAWVVRFWPRLDGPHRPPASEPAPFLSSLPATRGFLERLAMAARNYASQGLKMAASALAADHDRLAATLGLPLLRMNLEGVKARLEGGDFGIHPFNTPPRALGLGGWGEDGLTGHEDRRVPGLWYTDRQGDLHVGRKEPRKGTDTMDRKSHYRDAFALSEEWQDPGRWKLTAQIEMTTAFVSGGIALGWTRRDRNIRFGFQVGDAAYSAGVKPSAAVPDRLSWSLSDLYVRRGGQAGTVAFKNADPTFSLEILVDGPTAEVTVEGQRVAVVSTLDGRPIQGKIGFFTSQGAMRVRNPVVQRLDRLRWSPAGPALGGGLHPSRPGEDSWRELVRRPVLGLPLSVSGTLLLWFPEETSKKLASLNAGDRLQRVREVLERFFLDFEAEDPSQGVTVVLPKSMDPGVADLLNIDYAKRSPGGFEVAFHQRDIILEESEWTVQGWTSPALAFVDPAGILLWAQRYGRYRTGFPESMRKWMTIHHDHARTGLAGPKE